MPDTLDPIEELMQEHRIIEIVLSAVETAADRELPFDFYERAVDFFAEFADGCHHAKEEDRFFPRLERCGIPRAGGPIGVMCDEHIMGRDLIAGMRKAIEAKDCDLLRRKSLAYADLLRQHISKEDHVLFPMGRQLLNEEQLAELTQEFRTVEHDTACHTKYAALAEQLLSEAQSA